MTEADVQRLRAAGWSDEDVMDIAEVTGMFSVEPAWPRVSAGSRIPSTSRSGASGPETTLHLKACVREAGPAF